MEVVPLSCMQSAPHSQSPNWRRSVITLTGNLLVLSVFWPSIESLLLKWLQMQDAYSHGFLSLILASWLLRKQIHSLPPKATPDPLILAGLATLSALWSAAYFMHTEVLHQMCLPLVLALLLACRFDRNGAVRLLGASAVLFFAIPIWDYLNAPLQWLSVQVSSAALKLIHIDASIKGFFVTLDNGVFEIAGGCSGLRYLLVSLTVTYVYSFMNLAQLRYIVILNATGILFALLTNWVRVFTIIYIGHQSNMQHPLVADHENFGWYLYAATLVPLLIAAHFIELSDKRSRHALKKREDVSTAPMKGVPVRVRLLTLIAAIGIPVISLVTVKWTQPELFFGQINAPEQMGDWHRVYVLDNAYVAPQFVNYTQSVDTSFSRNQGEPLVSLHLRQYSRQVNGKELISNRNREFDTETWKLKGNFSLPDSSIQFLELENRESLVRHAVGYTYAIGDRYFSNKFDAKLGQLSAFFSSRRQDGALIQASSPCLPDCQAAVTRLEDFFTTALLPIRASLSKAYEASH